MTTYVFYVYAYLRESNNTPYYIGKGKGKRAISKHRNGLTPKDKSRIVFLETNLSDVGALALERRYIRWYGRKDNNTGILRNLTDGGEGSSGAILIRSEEHKQNISKSKKGKPGHSHTEETKQKISKSKKGKKRPDLVDYNKNRKHPFTNKKRPDHSARISGSNNPNFGKKTSPEKKQKIREGLARNRAMKLSSSYSMS
jgi:hypothetical protein